MELIGEIIAELVFEGLLTVAKGKYPLWLKIPAILLVSLICIAIVGLIGFIGVNSISDGHFIGGTVVLVMDISITVFLLKNLFKRK